MGIIIEEEVFREMTMVEVNTKEEEAREEMIRIILVTRIRGEIIKEMLIIKVKMKDSTKMKDSKQRMTFIQNLKWELRPERIIHNTNKLINIRKMEGIKAEAEVEAEVEEEETTTEIRIMINSTMTQPLNVRFLNLIVFRFWYKELLIL